MFEECITNNTSTKYKPISIPFPIKNKNGDKKSVCMSDFKKLKLLGLGNVGKVYLVKYLETGALYAMKVLSKNDMIAKKGTADMSVLNHK